MSTYRCPRCGKAVKIDPYGRPTSHKTGGWASKFCRRADGSK